MQGGTKKVYNSVDKWYNIYTIVEYGGEAMNKYEQIVENRR